jgi:hypothetical protein
MRKRSLKSLLQLLIDHIHIVQENQAGLCYLISELYWNAVIDRPERIKLSNFIRNNKPNLFQTNLRKFIILWLNRNDKDTYCYYFERGETRQRLRYLKYHIKRIS